MDSSDCSLVSLSAVGRSAANVRVGSYSDLSALPHSEQNLPVSGLSAEQAGQVTMDGDYTRPALREGNRCIVKKMLTLIACRLCVRHIDRHVTSRFSASEVSVTCLLVAASVVLGQAA